MEYNTAIKRDKPLIYATTVNLKHYAKKFNAKDYTYCMIPLVSNVQ